MPLSDAQGRTRTKHLIENTQIISYAYDSNSHRHMPTTTQRVKPLAIARRLRLCHADPKCRRGTKAGKGVNEATTGDATAQNAALTTLRPAPSCIFGDVRPREWRLTPSR